MGGTSFRTFASMAFEEADMMGWWEVKFVDCSRLPTLSTRSFMKTVRFNRIRRKQRAKQGFSEAG
jgi:hypothetical protein